MLDKISKFLSNKDLDVSRVYTYLKKYGYIKDTFSLEDIATGIIRLKKTAGLDFSSETIDGKLVRAMESPRCSLPDHEFLIEEAGSVPKWGMKTLTYCISGYDEEMSREDWEQTIRVALDNISAVCGLTFIKVSSVNEANLVYDVGRGRQDDFDGSSGTLAWFQLPSSSSYRGQLFGKFDLDETWIPFGKNGRGIYLENVVCHETMHGIGVSHVSVPNSLINPFYNPSINKPMKEDIRQLNDLRYGPPTQVSPKPDPTQTPIPTGNTTIILSGQISKIEIPGYRISKIS